MDNCENSAWKWTPDRRGGKRAVLLFLLFIGLMLSLLFFLETASASGASWNPETVLKTYLREHYPWADVDVSDLRLSSALPANAPVSVFVEKTPPGRSVFRLEFKGGGSLQATALVKAFDRVYMSRSALPKGYVLQQDDLYPTLMESGRIPRGALRSEQQALGKPLLRSIVPNAPLTTAMVSETPLVKRGHRVALIVESAGFTVKAAGETRNDAVVGAHVRAENLLSRKIVTGLLVDENTVRVEY